jgi:hypothetical protein
MMDRVFWLFALSHIPEKTSFRNALLQGWTGGPQIRIGRISGLPLNHAFSWRVPDLPGPQCGNIWKCRYFGSGTDKSTASSGQRFRKPLKRNSGVPGVPIAGVSAAVNRGVKWHSREIAGVVRRTKQNLKEQAMEIYDGVLREAAKKVCFLSA